MFSALKIKCLINIRKCTKSVKIKKAYNLINSVGGGMKNVLATVAETSEKF